MTFSDTIKDQYTVPDAVTLLSPNAVFERAADLDNCDTGLMHVAPVAWYKYVAYPLQ